MHRKAGWTLAAAVVLLSAPVEAQTTGLPIFLAPYRAFETTEIGASVVDPGRGWAAEGMYRRGTRFFDFGFRAGIRTFTANVPGPNGGKDRQTFFLTGVDARARVFDHTRDVPFDGAFTFGVGGQIGEGFARGFVPIGLSLGRRFEVEGSETSFVPYIHPVFTSVFGDDPDVALSFGLGVDVRVNRTLDIRLSAGLGDLDGVAIGFAILR